MKCSRCKKTPAVYSVKLIKKSRLITAKLCKGCLAAKEAELNLDKGELTLCAEPLFKNSRDAVPSAPGGLRCADCGLAFAEMMAGGLAGCAGCYSSFENEMALMLYHMHGSHTHAGGPAAPDKKPESSRTADDETDAAPAIRETLFSKSAARAPAWAETESGAGSVLYSKASISRNITGSNFAAKAGQEALHSTLEFVWRALSTSRLFTKPEKLYSASLSSAQQRFAQELCGPGEPALCRGYFGFWRDRAGLSACINCADHIVINSALPGRQPDAAFNRAAQAHSALAAQLDFARHPRFGYLTASPAKAGTGLEISHLLHLPALSRTAAVAPLATPLARLFLALKPFYMANPQNCGDFFVLGNAVSLGKTEEELKQLLAEGLDMVLTAEQQAATRFEGREQAERLENEALRDYGVLSWAKSLSYEETLALISPLRFALKLGIPLPAGARQINRILTLAQPGHIAAASRRPMTQTERDLARAALIKRILRPAGETDSLQL